MQRLGAILFLLTFLVFVSNSAFAFTANCKAKTKAEGITSIKLVDESLFINGDMEIPLEKSVIRCGILGRKIRMDGEALGYQVVLKSCSSDGSIEGHLIDSVKDKAIDVTCQ